MGESVGGRGKCRADGVHRNENWASSTKVVIGEEGSVEVVPENVRRVPCGTPTCP